jgi:hypothetical protein
MGQSASLRETLFHVAHEATASCIDNVMLGLNNMELACQNHRAQAEQLGEREIFELGRRMFRMSQINHIAERHVQEQAAIDDHGDPVEVHLAFQVRLRDRLGLPVHTQTMQFSQLARIRDSQLERTAHEIESAEAESPEHHIAEYETLIEQLGSEAPPLLRADARRHPLAQFLALDYTPWAQHISRHHSDAVQATQERMFGYLEWLGAQHAQGGINEQAFFEANNAAAFHATSGVAYRRALELIAHPEPAQTTEPDTKRPRPSQPDVD